MRILCDRTSYS